MKFALFYEIPAAMVGDPDRCIEIANATKRPAATCSYASAIPTTCPTIR
jgi:hypothetical protein